MNFIQLVDFEVCVAVGPATISGGALRLPPTCSRGMRFRCLVDFIRRLYNSDVLSRMGGEEFGVILPGTGQATAKPLMQMVLRELSAMLCPSSDGNSPPRSIAECRTAAATACLKS